MSSTCHQCHAPTDGGRFCDACGADQTAPRTASATPPPPRPPATGNGKTDDQLVTTVAERDLALLTSDGPNAYYLGRRLSFTQSGAEGFDVTRSLTQQTMAQVRQAFITDWVFFLIVGLPILVLLLFISQPLAALWSFLVFSLTVIALIMPFFRQQNFPLSEWKLLIDGKASTAGGVLDHVAAAVLRRNTPVEYRVVTVAGTGARGYLQIRDGRYNAFIAAFPFGDDLYIGWTLWWSGSYREGMRGRKPGIKYFILAPWYTLVEIAQGGKNQFEIAYVHQYDGVKALRELVHAVAREGVDGASGVVPLTGQGTIGTKVPEGPEPTFVKMTPPRT
jgi:hypothetical protein